MKNLKNTKGITLVALIITIIVLLILATDSINLVINEGILNKAKTAVDKYSEGEELEKIKFAVLSAKMKNNGELTTDNLNNELRVNLSDNTVIAEKIGNNWYYNGYCIDENGNVEKYDKLLPEEYQQVEYIQSTGTQFINTEIYPKSTTKVNFDFALVETGGYNGWMSAEYQESFTWAGSTWSEGPTTHKFISTISENCSWCNTDINADYNRHKFILYSGCQLFDGIKYGETTIGDTATDKQYLYLFAIHQEWNNRNGEYSKRCRKFL